MSKHQLAGETTTKRRGESRLLIPEYKGTNWAMRETPRFWEKNGPFKGFCIHEFGRRGARFCARNIQILRPPCTPATFAHYTREIKPQIDRTEFSQCIRLSLCPLLFSRSYRPSRSPPSHPSTTIHLASLCAEYIQQIALLAFSPLCIAIQSNRGSCVYLCFLLCSCHSRSSCQSVVGRGVERRPPPPS